MSATAPILLVEDNPDDRDLTIMALRESNVANSIELARDGEEALQYFADRARPLPALVLLDLKLPKIMGLDVLRRLRAEERTQTVPIVVLTSSREERDRHSSYAAGVNAYVCKPVDFDAFADAVRQVGHFWLGINEPPPAQRSGFDMSAAEPAGRRLQVLIVEDSEDDALLDVIVLEDAGYRVEWERVQSAEDLSRALDRRRWDVLLCDHSLPRFDSFSALALLSGARRPRTPLIVVSGAIGEETAVAVIREGAADFVNKNNLARLPTVVATVLRDARARRAAVRAQAQFRSAFDDAAFGSALIELGPRAGRLLRVNEALCAATGMTRSQLKRTRVQALIDRKHRPGLEGALEAATARTRSAYRAEVRFVAGTPGEPRWFLLSLAPVREPYDERPCAGGPFHRDHRAEARRRGTGARPSPGRRRLADEIRVHGECEPRDPHAAQRCHRPHRTARGYELVRRTTRIPGRPSHLRSSADDGDRAGTRFLEDRGRQGGADGGAVQATARSSTAGSQSSRRRPP